MFVGESGISRILERTCELMKQAGYSDDVRKLGGIDLPTIQKFLNLWFSVSVDLHGSEVSSNAATYFANGLKGRAKEAGFEDHKALHDHYHVEFYEDGAFNTHAVPMRKAMNEVLRDWYVGDCAAGVARWNRVMERHGIADRLKLPEPQVPPRDRHLLRLPLRSGRSSRSARRPGRRARTTGCRPTTTARSSRT